MNFKTCFRVLYDIGQLTKKIILVLFEQLICVLLFKHAGIVKLVQGYQNYENLEIV